MTILGYNNPRYHRVILSENPFKPVKLKKLVFYGLT